MHLRTILTTAIRQGRLTSLQKDALSRLFPLYGTTLRPNLILTPSLLLPEASEYVLEIGFGMGHSLIEMALTYPEKAYIGIELHQPGIGRVLAEIETHNIHNIRVIHGNALEALHHHLQPASLDTLQIFFPDPWPKMKHWKRRLVQAHTVIPMARVLKPGGMLHLATDWEDYAQHMMKTLEASSFYVNAHGPGQFAPRPDTRPMTKFENRGIRYGHGVWDLQFIKQVKNL